MGIYHPSLKPEAGIGMIQRQLKLRLTKVFVLLTITMSFLPATNQTVQAGDTKSSRSYRQTSNEPQASWKNNPARFGENERRPLVIEGLSPQSHERVSCSILAAKKYEVPANIVLAVAEKEGGKPGQWVKNSNGSHDVGPMQFNTTYLKDLARFGITAQDVAATGCYPYDLAAWRLRKHLQNDHGDIWTRAANYHSRTPEFNNIYRADLMRKAAKWAAWLEEHFTTREFNND